MNQIEGQMNIFNFIPDPDAPIEMPDFDESLLVGIKGLDEIMYKLPRYKVYFKHPVYSLPFPCIAKICVFVGYWHSLDGWNYKDKEIKSYEYIGEYDSKNNPIKFIREDYPYRYHCNRFCDVEYCSKICFERRGQIWDKTEHKWVRNEDGTIMFSGHRSCDVGVDEMRFLRKE
jgi:hypothetical protein